MLVPIDTLRGWYVARAFNTRSRTDMGITSIESWSRITQEGSKVLASIDRTDPSKTLPALAKVMQGLKDVLESMYTEYDRLMENSSHDARYQSEFETLSKCIEMYDQEYMLKESIQSIVKERGCYTQQHLNGCSALWITEPYIDQQFIQSIIQYNST